MIDPQKRVLEVDLDWRKQQDRAASYNSGAKTRVAASGYCSSAQARTCHQQALAGPDWRISNGWLWLWSVSLLCWQPDNLGEVRGVGCAEVGGVFMERELDGGISGRLE
jgi:hypothetical protein